jgi:hypothetical protein
MREECSFQPIMQPVFMWIPTSKEMKLDLDFTLSAKINPK